MKHFILLALLLSLFVTPCFAGSLDLNWQAAYSPPGGDIIVGDKIGRYVIDSELKYSEEWFRISAAVRAYGALGWINSDARGHGLDKFKDEYAYKADEWRLATTQRIELGKPDLYLFFHNYMPIDRHGVWGRGHGQETEYYYLFGAGGTFKLLGAD